MQIGFDIMASNGTALDGLTGGTQGVEGGRTFGASGESAPKQETSPCGDDSRTVTFLSAWAMHSSN